MEDQAAAAPAPAANDGDGQTATQSTPVMAAVSPEALEALPANMQKFVKDGQVDLNAVANSYKQAEGALTTARQQIASQVDAADPLNIPARGQVTGVGATGDWNAVCTAAGVSEQELAEEWDGAGKLNDEQYLKLQTSTNQPRFMVDEFMKGQAAIRESGRQKVGQALDSARTAAVGGMTHDANGVQLSLELKNQALQSLLNWAPRSGRSDAELANLQEQVRNPDLAPRAIQELKRDHDAALGAGGAMPLINTGTGLPGAGLAVNSQNFAQISARAGRGDRAAKAALTHWMASGAAKNSLL